MSDEKKIIEDLIVKIDLQHQAARMQRDDLNYRLNAANARLEGICEARDVLVRRLNELNRKEPIPHTPQPFVEEADPA